MDLTYTEILDTCSALKKTKDYLENTWDKVETVLRDKKRCIFIGCGSSYSLAKSMALMIQTETGLSSSAMAAGDVLLHAVRYAKFFDGAAIVCISRSGRTSELLLALDALKSGGYSFSTVSLVNADDTPLAAKSDFTISTPWAFDTSVCQTRSVSNFYFMAAYITAKMSNNHVLLEELEHIIDNGMEFLKKAEALADELSERPWTHCVVLADAEMEGIAEEGALAFKEICQLLSNYYHLLDLRHGPMVLVGKETLVLAALGVKNELEYKLVSDVKAKNADVVTFSDMLGEPAGTFDLFYGHPLSQIAKGIPFILLCQMVAYKKSKKTGADPDKPTGLEAWIAL